MVPIESKLKASGSERREMGLLWPAGLRNSFVVELTEGPRAVVWPSPRHNPCGLDV